MMSRGILWLTAGVLLSLASPVFAGQSPEVTAGAQTMQKLCSACHKPEMITASRRTRAQWEDVVEKMISKGVKGTDDELAAVVDYLAGQFGKVNVNNATASELTEVLGLTRDEAEAIVKHRRANGKFESFEALTKVPQIDVAKLEKAKRAIAY